MTGLPAVTVVTISYRDLVGLRRTVDSVAELDYGGVVEHVVVDGGSGPAVEHYLAGLGDRVAYWQSQPDGGRYAAMNVGAAKATGDVLWFMHSGDTFADPDSLSVAMRSLRTGWGYGCVRRVGTDGADLGIWGGHRFRPRRFAAGVAPIPHQGAYFRSDLFHSLGGYDEAFGLGADHLMMLRCAAAARPSVLDSVVCDFDATGAGTTRDLTDHFRDVRAALMREEFRPFRFKWSALAYVAWCESVARLKVFVRFMIGRPQV